MNLEALQDATAVALPFFALLITAEVLISSWRGLKAYDRRDFIGSMSQLMGNVIVQLLSRGAILGFYLWIYQFRLFTAPNDLLGLMVLAVVIDFQFYWFHRASHRIRILWAVHVSHHSSEYMNLGTALRQPWLGPLVKPIFYWPLPLLGFDPIAILAVGSLLTIYGFWTHTEQIPDIGKWGYIFVSPAHHRVHHGSNPLYIDKNYSNFLIVWDRIFGTYQAEVEPVNYGLTANIGTYNPWEIATHEFQSIARDCRRALAHGESVAPILFNPPMQSTSGSVGGKSPAVDAGS